MKATIALAVVVGLTIPGAAAAQFGAAAGIRSVSTGSAATRDRNGVEVRGLFDRSVSARLSVRGELAYTQMRIPAVDASGRYTINENGFELGVSARVPIRVALAQAYLLAGPVASFRAACGVDSHFDPNGRVPCAGEATSRVGTTLGVGVRGFEGDGFDWTAELRLLRGTVNAAGGSLVALSLGVQRRR